MKVVFVSNFMNHHQLPVALEMQKKFDYNFIATEPIAQEQSKMGYEDMNKKFDFIIRSYESEQAAKLAQQKIDSADVVVFGSCPFKMVEKRIKENKLTFRYSERIFKQKTLIRKFHPIMWKKYFGKCTKFRNKNYYLLCASAYAAKDYAWFGAFKEKAFKWGYFPEVENVDTTELFNLKKQNKKLKIVWCNRFVKYKHPEMAVEAAKFLKNQNFNFEIEMIGTGPLKEKIEKLIDKSNLKSEIKIIGSIPSSEVKNHLKVADICLLTADKGEGWGAVVNESLNYCCAVLCNKMTGSVPYLVEDGKNGFVYKTKKQFFAKLKTLAENSEMRYNFGKAGFETMKQTWNAKTAVQNFEKLLKGLKKGQLNVVEFGPCSKA